MVRASPKEPQELPRATPFSTSGNQAWAYLSSFSILPSDPLLCSHGFSNPMYADSPNLSSGALPEPLKPCAPAISNSRESPELARLFHAPHPLPRVSIPPVHLSLNSQPETPCPVKSFLHPLIFGRETWQFLTINIHVTSECDHLLVPSTRVQAP